MRLRNTFTRMISLNAIEDVWVQCGRCSQAATCVVHNHDPFATSLELRYFCAMDLEAYLLSRPAYFEYLLAKMGIEGLAPFCHRLHRATTALQA
jgi:hypothetical protein